MPKGSKKTTKKKKAGAHHHNKHNKKSQTSLTPDKKKDILKAAKEELDPIANHMDINEDDETAPHLSSSNTKSSSSSSPEVTQVDCSIYHDDGEILIERGSTIEKITRLLADAKITDEILWFEADSAECALELRASTPKSIMMLTKNHDDLMEMSPCPIGAADDTPS